MCFVDLHHNQTKEIMNDLLTSLQSVKTSPNGLRKFSASYQINTHGNVGYESAEIKGTRADVAKFVKSAEKKLKDALFLESTYVLYIEVSYEYATVKHYRIDLHKRNY